MLRRIKPNFCDGTTGYYHRSYKNKTQFRALHFYSNQPEQAVTIKSGRAPMMLIRPYPNKVLPSFRLRITACFRVFLSVSIGLWPKRGKNLAC
jgi:hypothetical protein